MLLEIITYGVLNTKNLLVYSTIYHIVLLGTWIKLGLARTSKAKECLEKTALRTRSKKSTFILAGKHHIHKLYYKQ